MVYIVPFIKEPVTATICKYWLLLERNGTHLIELPKGHKDSAEASVDFMSANEITMYGVPRVSKGGDLVFIEVSAADKELANFYTWKEVGGCAGPSTGTLKEAWRMFLFASGGDPFGLNARLADITIGGSNTVLSVLSSVAAEV